MLIMESEKSNRKSRRHSLVNQIYYNPAVCFNKTNPILQLILSVFPSLFFIVFSTAFRIFSYPVPPAQMSGEQLPELISRVLFAALKDLNGAHDDTPVYRIRIVLPPHR